MRALRIHPPISSYVGFAREFALALTAARKPALRSSAHLRARQPQAKQQWPPCLKRSATVFGQEPGNVHQSWEILVRILWAADGIVVRIEDESRDLDLMSHAHWIGACKEAGEAVCYAPRVDGGVRGATRRGSALEAKCGSANGAAATMKECISGAVAMRS